MRNKISVITVVFNDVTHIRETMESFFSQTWEDKEYIVIVYLPADIRYTVWPG